MRCGSMLNRLLRCARLRKSTLGVNFFARDAFVLLERIYFLRPGYVRSFRCDLRILIVERPQGLLIFYWICHYLLIHRSAAAYLCVK